MNLFFVIRVKLQQLWHKALQKYYITEKSCALYFQWIILVQ